MENFSQLVEWFDSEYMDLFKRLELSEETKEWSIFKWIFETFDHLFLMWFLKEMDWEESGYSKNLWNWKWEVVYNIPFIK